MESVMNSYFFVTKHCSNNPTLYWLFGKLIEDMT